MLTRYSLPMAALAALCLSACIVSPDTEVDSGADARAATDARPANDTRAADDAGPIDARPANDMRAADDARPIDARPANDARPASDSGRIDARPNEPDVFSDDPDALPIEPVACPDDLGNANAAPFDLDVAPGISQNGALLRGQVLAVPLDLTACPGTDDLFRLAANDGDRIEIWATSDDLAGDVWLELLDHNGFRQGPPGLVTAVGDPPSPALAGLANPGEYRVAVRALDLDAVVPYTLFLRVDPGLPCGRDVWEVGPGAVRNDTADEATPLLPLAPGGTRFVQSGEICNVAGNDRDWYRYPLPPADARTCITAHFDAEAGALVGAQVFFVPPNPVQPPACLLDLDCDLGGDGHDRSDGFCVDGFCRAPDGLSPPGALPALIDFSRGQAVGPGDGLVMVDAANGGENGYLLTVTTSVAGNVCEPDVYEDNNNPGNDTYLGAGQAGVCDAWVCNNERGIGDWYSFDLLPGTLNRTVLVTYNENSDGRVTFLVFFDDNGGVFVEPPLGQPADPREACVNSRGSALGGRVFIGVMGDRENPADGDDQIDYTLRILPTDLDLDPDGRCDEFIGSPANVWSVDQP